MIRRPFRPLAGASSRSRRRTGRPSAGTSRCRDAASREYGSEFLGYSWLGKFFDRVKVAISFRFGKCCPRAGFPSRGRPCRRHGAGSVFRHCRFCPCRETACRGRFCPGKAVSGSFSGVVPTARPERVGGRSRHRASKTVFPAGIRMAGPNGLPPPCGNREVAFLAIRRHGRLSRAGFCPQVRKAVFVISIFLSTTCGSARRSAALWDCRPACRSGGLPILRA